MAGGFSFKTRRHGFDPYGYFGYSWSKVTYEFIETPKVAEFDDIIYNGNKSMCDQRKAEYLRFYFATPNERGSFWNPKGYFKGPYKIHEPLVVDIWELIAELEKSPETYRALKDHRTGAIFYLKISL